MFRLIVLAMLVAGCAPDSNQAESAPPVPQEPQPQQLDLSAETVNSAVQEVLEDAKSQPSMVEPEAALPDLFGERREDKKARLTGKVLTKEEAKDLRDSVDGLQVELKVPTQ